MIVARQRDTIRNNKRNRQLVRPLVDTNTGGNREFLVVSIPEGNGIVIHVKLLAVLPCPRDVRLRVRHEHRTAHGRRRAIVLVAERHEEHAPVRRRKRLVELYEEASDNFAGFSSGWDKATEGESSRGVGQDAKVCTRRSIVSQYRPIEKLHKRG